MRSVTLNVGKVSRSVKTGQIYISLYDKDDNYVGQIVLKDVLSKVLSDVIDIFTYPDDVCVEFRRKHR